MRVRTRTRKPGKLRTPMAAGSALLLAALVLTSFESVSAERKKRIRIRGRCSSCHKDATNEWKESPHQTAYSNPVFAKMTNNYENKACLGCHAPVNIHTKGEDGALTAREENLDSGVDCYGCHQDAEGNQHHHTVADDGTVTAEEIKVLPLCGGCHAKNGTLDEFKATQWAGEAQACAHCHMTPVKRPRAGGEPEGTAHTHAFRGKTNPELLQKGLRLEASAADGKLTVKLTSQEVGHKFPTGEPTKQVLIEVKLGDLTEVKTLTKADADGNDTRLPPGETCTFEVDTKGAKGKATVRLIHKASAEVSEEESHVLLAAQVDV